MSRSADQVLAEMLSLLPSGWAWPHDAGEPAQAGSLLTALLRPMATGIAELEAAAEAAMAEVDPRTAAAALADFERLLGADPCGRDISALDSAARRRIVHGRYTARGGASRDYFGALAAALGTDITITEAIASQAGQMQAGDELVGAADAFVWVVTLPLGAWDEFRAGEAGAGDMLYSFTPSDLECEIRRRAPAHTEPVFAYAEVA